MKRYDMIYKAQYERKKKKKEKTQYDQKTKL